MKRFIMVLVNLLFVGIFTFAFLFLPSVAGAQSPQAKCGKWSIVSSPNPGMFNGLSGVAALSPGDVWAVGRFSGNNGNDQTLVEHWDGAAWSVISSPNQGMSATLNGVATIASNNVWAVGASVNGKSFNVLIEHWDGSSWSIVPSHDPGTGDSLDGVAAIASNDVWAVGSSSGQTLTEHWNGKKWSIVPTPASTNASLIGIAAIASNDVWAVGSSNNQTLTENWDGTAWSIVPSLNIVNSNFNGVSAVPNSTNLFAVGNYVKGKNSLEKTLVGQWNGTSWSKINSPNVSKKDLGLSSVAALSSNNAWAVGGAIDPNTFQARALIEQWNGSKWKIARSPLVNGFLDGVTTVPSSNILWAVGTTISGRTVTESYCSKQ